MPFFKKKPVVIEAMQLLTDTAQEVSDFVGLPVRWTVLREPAIDIPTLEGTMTAGEGDWIIKGVQGEFYPCKSDIFEATYQPVSVPA